MTVMTLGHLRNALHAGCAAAVARVLDAHEVEVDFVDADPDELPALLDKEAIDILVSAWLPRDENLVQYDMRVLGTLYRPLYAWASYDAHGPVSGLASDQVGTVLVNMSDEARMRGLLRDMTALSDVPVKVCPDEALYREVEAARLAGMKPLVFVIQPHALFNDEALAVLDDARLPVEMEASVMVREAVAACADRDMLDELSEMTLGNRVMSALDYAIQVDNMDPEEAAEAWQRGRLVSR